MTVYGANVAHLMELQRRTAELEVAMQQEHGFLDATLTAVVWRGPDREQMIERAQALLGGPRGRVLATMNDLEQQASDAIRRQQAASDSPHSPGHVCGPGTPFAC